MNVFLTGITGLIGGEIAVRLLNRGWQVCALVRAQDQAAARKRVCTRLKQSPYYIPFKKQQLKIVLGDITQDYHNWIFENDERYSLVIHCAANTSFLLEPTQAHPNVQAVNALLHFMRAQYPASKFIFFSTAAVNLAPASSVVGEQHPFGGFVNGYTFSKRLAEEMVKRAGFEYLILRPSIVLSRNIANRQMARSILWVIWALLELEQFPINPNSNLDIVPVDYVADLTAQLAEKSHHRYDCYHLTAGQDAGETCETMLTSLYASIPKANQAGFLSSGSWQSSRHSLVKHKRLIEAVNYYLPFINANIVYANERILTELLPQKSVCPKVTSYLPNLMQQFNAVEAYQESLNP